MKLFVRLIGEVMIIQAIIKGSPHVTCTRPQLSAAPQGVGNVRGKPTANFSPVLQKRVVRAERLEILRTD